MFVGGVVTVSLSDFVINKHKVALDSSIFCFLINESALRGIHLPLFLPKRGLNDIKPGSLGQILFFYVRAVGRGDFCDLILHNSEHLSNCKVDAASKLVLVIDLEPSVENLDDLRFEDFGDSQVSEFLVLQDREVFLSFRTLTECFAV